MTCCLFYQCTGFGEAPGLSSSVTQHLWLTPSRCALCLMPIGGLQVDQWTTCPQNRVLSHAF